MELSKVKSYYYLMVSILHLYMMYWIRSVIKSPWFIHLSFLTILSFNLNLFYFITSTILSNLRKTHILYSNKFNGLFKFNFSLSLVVCLMYWGMVVSSPELLFKSNFRVPLVLDIFLHGGTFFVNLLEILLISPRKDNKNVGLLSYSIFAVFYGSYLNFLYHYHNVVIYPFVKLGLYGQLGINLCCIAMIWFGDLVYKRLTIKEVEEAMVEHKKD